MADFDEAVNVVFANEGGYSTNPLDPGGETNFGITKKNYPDLNIRALTQADAKSLYYRDYWVKHLFTMIQSQPIANKVFDLAVNLGPKTAIRILQQALSFFVAGPIVCDGVIGDLTLAAINEVPEDKLLQELRARYAQYHCQLLVDQGVKLTGFMLGWLRRDCQ